MLRQLTAGQPAATILKAARYTKSGFREVCRSGKPPLSCFPGIIESLRYLKDHGVTLGVATNLPAWMAEPMAEATGVSPLLETLVDFGATRGHKPSPDPLIEAMKRLGIHADSSMWYVGDHANDAAAAQAAGLLFAWASWGSTASEAPGESSLTLHEPSELRGLLSSSPEEA